MKPTHALVNLLLLFATVSRSADLVPAKPEVPVPLSEQFSLQSEILDRSYTVSVRLPPGYDQPANLARRYPVVYFTDAPFSFPLITGLVHLPMAQGSIEDLILVGIGYSQGVTPRESRVLDYTPTGNPAFQNATGGAPAYLRFLERELIPSIEKQYRANPERRALAGHSFGGLFGAWVLLNRPGLFRHYILSSPSFWFHQYVMWKVERDYAARHRDLSALVYMGIGELEHPPRGSDYEMVKDVQQFDSALRSRDFPGLQLRTKIIPGATHETAIGPVMLSGLLWHFTTDRTIAWDY